MLWENLNGCPKDDLTEQQFDKVRWIDTSTMLADPLTKSMKADRLVAALDKSQIDLTPTAASTIAKMVKQKQRRKTREDDHLLDDDGLTYDLSYAEDWIPATSDNVDLKKDLTSEYSSYASTIQTPNNTILDDDPYVQGEGVAHSALTTNSGIEDKSHECETTLVLQGDTVV